MPLIAREYLQFLYGPAAARSLDERLSAMIEEWRPRLPPLGPPRGRAGLGLTEKDAMVITYADHVIASEAGEPPLRVLANFCEEHLKGFVSAVHVLPFYPWSSDDGFSVKDYFAVDPDYGSWDDIRRLRAAGFDLMFDAVFNHVSAQGEWFQEFLAEDSICRDFFITVAGEPDLSQVVRPRALPLLTEFSRRTGAVKVWTTFSADQVDLNFKNPEVLLRVLEALLFYVANGARFIRLDAIAFLWKEIGTPCLHLPQTHALIQLLRAVLDEVAPSVLLITETNVPHAENVSYLGNGKNEAQLVYNFALPPLVMHSFAAGDAEKLTSWASSLALPSDQVTFFNFLASHDGVGLNPARGILSETEIDNLVRRTLEHGGLISYKNMPDGRRSPYELNINYLDALSNPTGRESQENAVRKLLTAHGILYSLQGVPGVYFHSLFGSRGDLRGAEASGIPRRINREKLRQAELLADLRDTGTLRHRVLFGQRELLHMRREHTAFAPGAKQRILALDRRVFAVLRESAIKSDTVICLHNVSADRVTVDLRQVLPGTRWTPLQRHDQSGAQGRVDLEPWATGWLEAC